MKSSIWVESAVVTQCCFFFQRTISEGAIPAHSMCVARCENLVLEAVQSSPLVFSLVSALNRAGCTFSLARHVACEPLPPGMLGGFDKDLNQVHILLEWKLMDGSDLGCDMFGQVSGPGEGHSDLDPRIGSYV